MAINPKIKQKAEDIRKKIFGSEVRESLASGIEAISEDVEATIGRQGYVEEQFQDVLDETTGKDVISAPELIAARNGKSNLKTRLDDEHAQVTAQLQQTRNDLDIVSNRKFFTLFDEMPTVEQLGEGEIGLVVGEVIYPVHMPDGLLLDNGFTFRKQGAIATGTEVVEGEFHLNTLDETKKTPSEQPPGVSTIYRDFSSTYQIDFDTSYLSTNPFSEGSIGTNLVHVYDVGLNSEILTVNEHIASRKVTVLNSQLPDGFISLQVAYFDSNGAAKFWNGTSWQSGTSNLSYGKKYPISVSLKRNADNSYTIVCKNTDTDEIIANCTTGTDVRNASANDRIFLGDNVIGTEALANPSYGNTDILIKNMVIL